MNTYYKEGLLKVHTQNLLKKNANDTVYLRNKDSVKFNCEIPVKSLKKKNIFKYLARKGKGPRDLASSLFLCEMQPMLI